MLRSVVLALGVSVVLSTGVQTAVVPAVGSTPPSGTVVVDDDGVQCGSPAFTTIAAAVTAARPGDRVRVCPGRYAERVVIDKPLTVTGQPAAVTALDCVAETPSEPDDLDTSVVPVLEPPDNDETPVLRIMSDRVEVAGLVIQGVDDQEPYFADGYPLFDAALTTDDSHAGWRVHDNMFRMNFLAVELGGDSDRRSRFDHNCLRDNAYAVANQRYTLTRARLDHNTTFRSVSTAYEIGWGYRGTSAVTLDHNTSLQDTLAIYAENNDRLTLLDNLVRQAGRGINLAGNDTNPRVLGNTVTGATAGAAVTVNPIDPASSAVTGLVLRGNTLSRNQFSGFTTGGLANLSGALIAANTLNGNKVSGIVLAPGTHDNTLVANVAEGNAQYGIRAFAATEDNLLVHNRLLGNVLADALDETAINTDGVTELANHWVATMCVVDVPDGAICRRISEREKTP